MDPKITSHQFELFYYVARYGGIVAAARNFPSGIGPPAISGQMSGLESRLGVRLFERKPFQLTGPGLQLYAQLRQSYDGLGALVKQLRDGPVHVLRLAADDMIGPAFLPTLIAATAPRSPDTGFELLTSPPDAAETWLCERQVHLLITAADRRIRGVRSLTLARPGLRLLVRRKAKISSPGHFWRQRKIAEPLICPLQPGAVHQAFGRGLRALHVEWPAGIRVDSTALMLQLVADGHGVGVGVELPSQAQHPEILAIPLPNFEPMPLVALWRRAAEPQLGPWLVAARNTARRLWPAASAAIAIWHTGPWCESAREFIVEFGALAGE